MRCDRFKCFSAAALLLLAAASPAAAQSGQIIGTGPLSIGMTRVETKIEQPQKGESPNLSQVIARTVEELLPTYIQRGFEKGLDRRVSIVSVSTSAFPDVPGAQPLSAIVSPSVVSLGSFGVRAAVGVTGRRTSGEPFFTFSEFVLLSPNVNLGELDDRLTELGSRVAKKLTEATAAAIAPERKQLPNGIVGFYCISPQDPNDFRLRQLARTLTIELPFHLNEASLRRRLDLVVRGLDLKEALITCEQRLTSQIQSTVPLIESRIENFSWTGTLAADSPKSETARLVIRVGEGGKNFRALSPVVVDNFNAPRLPAIAEQIVEKFANQHTAR